MYIYIISIYIYIRYCSSREPYPVVCAHQRRDVSPRFASVASAAATSTCRSPQAAAQRRYLRLSRALQGGRVRIRLAGVPPREPAAAPQGPRKKTWSCKTCNWPHPTTHWTCDWCDKSAGAKPAGPKPPVVQQAQPSPKQQRASYASVVGGQAQANAGSWYEV